MKALASASKRPNSLRRGRATKKDLSVDANSYQVGKMVNVASAKVDRAQTKPPPYYTEQSLLDDMCTAHKFAKTDEDRVVLRQIAGIGTARTRGGAIEGLVRRGFVERKKAGKNHHLLITAQGRELLSCLPAEIKDVTMTAKWERALAMVAEGKASGQQLRDKVSAVLRQTVPGLLAQKS